MKYSTILSLLITNLEKSSKVNSYDRKEEKEAVRLAHAIVDIVESLEKMKKISLTLISNNEIMEEDIEDKLLEIGEELRHIIYHIKDTEYYKYLTV